MYKVQQSPRISRSLQVPAKRATSNFSSPRAFMGPVAGESLLFAKALLWLRPVEVRQVLPSSRLSSTFASHRATKARRTPAQVPAPPTDSQSGPVAVSARAG